MVPGPDRAAIAALVGWRALGPAYATPAPTGMGASVSGRCCVRFRRRRRGPPARRRPPPAAGRPARWRGRCAGPGARVIASGQDAAAAGSRPASRPAGIAGPAVPRAGTAVSSAPRITAAEEPQGPGRADWPGRPDRIVVAISAANPHGSPPAANVAATPTTSAAGDDAEAGTRPPRRPRSSLYSRARPGLLTLRTETVRSSGERSCRGALPAIGPGRGAERPEACSQAPALRTRRSRVCCRPAGPLVSLCRRRGAERSAA